MASGVLVLTHGVQYIQVAGPGPVVVVAEDGGRETSGEGVSCLQPTSSNRRPMASNHLSGTILERLHWSNSKLRKVQEIYKNKTGATSTLLNTSQLSFYCTSICIFKIKEIKCIKINEILNRFIPN